MKNEKGDYLTLSKLKERGWTKAKIDKWLGKPDKSYKNPYNSSSMVKLYLIKRVIKIEESDLFQEWRSKSLKKREKMSNIMKEIVQKKRDELLNYIGNLKIEIPLYPKKDLYLLAVSHYNSLWLNRGKSDKKASLDSDEKFPNRITVNMLRHDFNHYELELSRLFGKVGKMEGYCLLKDRIHEEIYRMYPYLK